jgi:hypothetical protein
MVVFETCHQGLLPPTHLFFQILAGELGSRAEASSSLALSLSGERLVLAHSLTHSTVRQGKAYTPEMKLFDFPCRPLGIGQGDVSLTDLLASNGRDAHHAVLDLYTTQCTRCPAKMDEMEALAASGKHPGVAFIGVNLDDHDGATKQANGRWTHLQMVSVDPEVKDSLKLLLGLRFVPYLVVIAADGRILAHGGPKVVNLSDIAAVMDEEAHPTLAGPLLSSQSLGASNSSADGGRGGGDGDEGGCIGRVCPLPQRQKSNPVATEESQDEGVCLGGVCPFPRRTKKTQSVSSAVAEVTECVGDSCPLPPRRSKPAPVETTRKNEGEHSIKNSPELSDDSTVTTEPPSPSSSTSSASDAECPKGACLVRPNFISAASRKEVRPPAPGDSLPTLGLHYLHDSVEAADVDLEQLRAGRVMVLCLWTSTCDLCPAALSEMATLAAACDKSQSIFIGVNVDSHMAGREKVAKLGQEGGWDELVHLHMDTDAKRIAMGSMGLQFVPFYVIVDAEGHISQMGMSKDVNLNSVGGMIAAQKQVPENDSLQPHAEPTRAPATTVYTFSLDEDF